MDPELVLMRESLDLFSSELWAVCWAVALWLQAVLQSLGGSVPGTAPARRLEQSFLVSDPRGTMAAF